jgi:hypothetical protein
MKKAAIIGMATFYLLLTTGMFVCMVHCAAESLTSKPAMAMGHGNKHKKQCAGGSDCDCCKKHGEYVVKENLKPGSDLQFSTVAVLLGHTIPAGLFTPRARLTNYTWTDSKAPPGKSGKLISIQFRTLQI